jgi:hypothetical protein
MVMLSAWRDRIRAGIFRLAAGGAELRGADNNTVYPNRRSSYPVQSIGLSSKPRQRSVNLGKPEMTAATKQPALQPSEQSKSRRHGRGRPFRRGESGNPAGSRLVLERRVAILADLERECGRPIVGTDRVMAERGIEMLTRRPRDHDEAVRSAQCRDQGHRPTARQISYAQGFAGRAWARRRAGRRTNTRN